MAGYRSISDISDMLNSMLAGEAERFEMNLELILRNYVSFMEGIAKWHHGVLNAEQCEAAVAEIQQRIDALKS